MLHAEEKGKGSEATAESRVVYTSKEAEKQIKNQRQQLEECQRRYDGLSRKYRELEHKVFGSLQTEGEDPEEGLLLQLKKQMEEFDQTRARLKRQHEDLKTEIANLSHDIKESEKNQKAVQDDDNAEKIKIEKLQNEIRSLQKDPQAHQDALRQKEAQLKESRGLQKNKEAIVNLHLRRINQYEEKKALKEEECRSIEEQFKQVEKQYYTYQVLYVEKKSAMRIQAMLSQKQEMDKLINRLKAMLQQMNEYGVSSLAKKNPDNKGLRELLEESSNQIKRRKNDLLSFKVNQNDPFQEVTKSYIDILSDYATLAQD